MAIDNKMIILRKNAGYYLEPVVVLWYNKIIQTKGENYGKQTQTAR